MNYDKKDSLKKYVFFQRVEQTHSNVYHRLSKKIKNPENKIALEVLSNQEKGDYLLWKNYTKVDVPSFKFYELFYYLCSLIFGLTFGVKLMEKGKGGVENQLVKSIVNESDLIILLEKEQEKEKELVGLINEERLNYVGSIVLGLNDALVELTAMLSGITFAIHDSKTVIITAFITGISAAFSMAGSEYLSSKADGGTKNAKVSAIITGIAYMFTVIILLLPYLMFSNLYIALLFTIINAILIILLFNFYISIAKDLDFKKRFAEMLTISLGVSFLSFLIGLLISKVF